jgi:hypothetical protein
MCQKDQMACLPFTDGESAKEVQEEGVTAGSVHFVGAKLMRDTGDIRYVF